MDKVPTKVPTISNLPFLHIEAHLRVWVADTIKGQHRPRVLLIYLRVRIIKPDPAYSRATPYARRFATAGARHQQANQPRYR